jgi:small GTP-binding protein
MVNTTLKIIILGDTYSGKSSLMGRICKDEYSSTFISTIGVDYSRKIISKNNITYKCNIWDTSGQDKFNLIVSSYYRNVSCAIILYDVTNLESYKNIQKWISELQDINTFTDLLIFVIGNKIDLTKERKVSTEEAEEFCELNNYLFLEISVKDSINTSLILNKIIDSFQSKIQNNDIYINKTNGTLITKLEMEKEPKSKYCCNIL